MIGEHEAADFMRALYVGGFLGDRYLNGGRSPADKIGELPLSDPLKTLVNLRRINFSLNDVHNRDVLSFFRLSAHHNVLRLQESSHNIQHGRLPDSVNLSIDRDRSVPGHEEVALRNRH